MRDSSEPKHIMIIPEAGYSPEMVMPDYVTALLSESSMNAKNRVNSSNLQKNPFVLPFPFNQDCNP